MILHATQPETAVVLLSSRSAPLNCLTTKYSAEDKRRKLKKTKNKKIEMVNGCVRNVKKFKNCCPLPSFKK